MPKSRMLRKLLIGATVIGVLNLCVGALAQSGSSSPLKIVDVSPDAPYGSTFREGDTPIGRIVAVVVDPNNENVLYAASEWAGIWKSTDKARTWQQASNGLRNGLTQELPSVLAIDPGNSQHLLYVAQEVDGRNPFQCQTDPTKKCTFGGLWTSVDGAASWQHVEFPPCPRSAVLPAQSLQLPDRRSQ